MKHAAANIVLKLLNFEQKQHRMNIAQEMLMTFNDDSDLLKKVITGAESRVYGYATETKAQSSQWNIETEAVGDTKKYVSEVFRGLEQHFNISNVLAHLISKSTPKHD